jgi:hypothetical protein
MQSIQNSVIENAYLGTFKDQILKSVISKSIHVPTVWLDYIAPMQKWSLFADMYSDRLLLHIVTIFIGRYGSGEWTLKMCPVDVCAVIACFSSLWQNCSGFLGEIKW